MRRGIAASAAVFAVAALTVACGAEARHQPHLARPHAQGTPTADPLTKNVTGGLIHGMTGASGAYAWLGIPFAAPPTDSLRWTPPKAPTAWAGTLQATSFGYDCPQDNSSYLSRQLNASEDCLTLNVFSPANATSEPRAVMVFFYGGSYVHGGSNYFVYNGGPDVGIAKDRVVVVTANYRLGALGYLGHDALRSRDKAAGSTGNYGLLDQRAALEWVRDNIAAFGGDPKRVFAFGESAGAGSMSAHLVAPGSFGLFARAGMESGPCAATWVSKTMADSSLHFGDVAKNLGCPAAPADAITCMQGKSWAELVAAQKAVTPLTDGSTAWGPVIDGVELTDRPAALVAAGKWAQVPVLLGSNHDEGNSFNPMPKDVTLAGLQQMLLKGGLAANASEVAKILAVYAGQHFPTVWDLGSRIIGDSTFTCPTRWTAAHLASTVSAPSTTKVFYYMWDHVPLFDSSKGVFHGSELVFVFHTDIALLSPAEQALSDQMVGYWARFAETGNPNGGGAVAWPAYGAAGGGDVNIALNYTMSTQTGLREAACDMWDSMGRW